MFKTKMGALGSRYHRQSGKAFFETAAERLRQSEDSILSVAEAVGFETLSNFNQQFKKRYGVTPRDYRRGSGPDGADR